jgi:hypothetical protein
MLLNGVVPTPISDTDIEAVINSFNVVNDCIAYAFDQAGHQMLVLTFPTANRTLLYDGTTQIWSEFQSGTAEYSRHIGSLGVNFNFSNYVSDFQSRRDIPFRSECIYGRSAS